MAKTISVTFGRFTSCLAYKEEYGKLSERMRNIEELTSSFSEIGMPVELYIASANAWFMRGRYLQHLNNPPAFIVLPRANYDDFSDREILTLTVYEFFQKKFSGKMRKISRVLAMLFLIAILAGWLTNTPLLHKFFAYDAIVYTLIVVLGSIIFVEFTRFFTAIAVGDKNAIKLTGDPEAFISALRKISMEFNNSHFFDLFTRIVMKCRILILAMMARKISNIQ